jgi:hypothetical protein
MPATCTGANCGNAGSLPELNAIIAVFSTGPVGVGDGMGATDKSIVLPTCDAAGRLLQPDRPLLAVDATFAKPGQDSRGEPNGVCKSSWMSKADGGAVWSSVTRVANSMTFFTLAINVSRPWALRRDDFWPRARTSVVLVSRAWDRARPCINGSSAVASGCVSLSTSSAVPLPSLQSYSAASSAYAHGESPFVLLATHEVLPNGWVVWEDGKYVSVSRRRFSLVQAVATGLEVTVSGAAAEVVQLVALRPTTAARRDEPGVEWTVASRHVIVGADGTATVSIE